MLPVVIIILAIIGLLTLIACLMYLIESQNCINIKCREKGTFTDNIPYCSYCGERNKE